ncbi:MAG: T9SS type A sorting domain-containing protein [Bacteroidetes bacterium]|nr:T9SS type A sorting domain-containing protein [Bacteroidota bacterium]
MKKSLFLFSALVFFSGADLFSQTSVTFSYTGASQTFTVPSCVNAITIDSKGAQGGAGVAANPGGLGARIVGTCNVTPGDVITILVGQRGLSTGNSGGGGGGSFVYDQTTSTLLIASGGGGGGGNSTNGLPGQSGTSGTNGVGGSSSGAGGSGGGGGGGASGYGGAGGGGYCGDGGNCALTYSTGGAGGSGCMNGADGSGSVCNGTKGRSFLNGGAGGTWAASGCAGMGADGGYGGGGATIWGNLNGGGGGGYSGGGGGGYNSSFDGGGGGGSFNSGTSQTNTAGFQSGNGEVIITYSPGVPSPAGSITGSSSVCAGSGGTYFISSVSGATSYTWTVPSGTTINSGQGTVSISITFGSTSGNITVTPGNSCGSGTPSSLAVTVNPSPTVTTTTTGATICTGNPTSITASGATTYSWMPGSLSGTTITVSPSSTTTYTVTGTSSGCSSTATQLITVNPTPTVTTTTTNSAICSGDSTSITASGATAYNWMPGNLSGATVVVTPSSTTSYTVTGTDLGCSSAATQLITVNATPTVTVSAINPTICSGSSTTLIAGGASAYLWMPGNLSGSSVTVTPGATTTFTVTGTNGSCSSTATQLITVNNPPTVNLGNDTTQCGGNILLDAQNPGSTYLWGTSATTQTITVNTSGTYSVVVTDANGCSGNDAVNVTINPIPNLTLSASNMTPCVNDGLVSLTGLPAGGTWTGPGVSGNNFNPTTAGVGPQILTYSYTDSIGCSNSQVFTISVNACTGIAEQNFANGISVFPNPNSGVFTLSVNANVGDVQITITDVQGRIIYSSLESNVTAGFTKQIDLGNVSSGLYLVKLNTANEQHVEQISVQR